MTPAIVQTPLSSAQVGISSNVTGEKVFPASKDHIVGCLQSVVVWAVLGMWDVLHLCSSVSQAVRQWCAGRAGTHSMVTSQCPHLSMGELLCQQ